MRACAEAVDKQEIFASLSRISLHWQLRVRSRPFTQELLADVAKALGKPVSDCEKRTISIRFRTCVTGEVAQVPTRGRER